MPTILFVCAANRCRSPISAAICQHRLMQLGLSAKWQVESAGIWTRAGLPATRTAHQALAEHGLDLGAHRSREVSRALVEAADQIVVMEQSQREALALEWPQVRQRIMLLSELGDQRYDLPDPDHADLDAVRSTTRVIARLIGLGVAPLVRAHARSNRHAALVPG